MAENSERTTWRMRNKEMRKKTSTEAEAETGTVAETEAAMPPTPQLITEMHEIL